MVVYSGNITDFHKDEFNGLLVEKLIEIAKDEGYSADDAQKAAWSNSLMRMDYLLSNSTLPKDCGVAIELQVPPTNKRIDFVLTGRDSLDKKIAILVELKQWSKAEKVEGKRQLVKTYVGGGYREVTHPSYQVVGYATLIHAYNTTVEKEQVGLKELAYLHNYYLKDKDDPLEDKEYQPYLSEAPLFGAEDQGKLITYLQKYLHKGDRNREILAELKNGEIRPTKSLQDSISQMLAGKQEFFLIDQQKVVYEEIMALARNSFRTKQKRVFIVKGGPGTGKSVLAINLLAEMTIKDNKIATYLTKNSAPRKVFESKLANNPTQKARIHAIFSTPDSIAHIAKDGKIFNAYDAILVDEAHRLTYNDRFYPHANFIKDIINESLFSVFFIDESQSVTWSDYATVDKIKVIASNLGVPVSEAELESQFRCNGADGYLEWLDDVLEIKPKKDMDWLNFNYDFHVCSNPDELRDFIYEKNKVANKSRMVAGYCWTWNRETRSIPDHVDIDFRNQGYTFALPWNLDNSAEDPWAINPGSVGQVGCIHTCQGLEFDYVGVIIGEDLRYENGHIITDPTQHPRDDAAMHGWRALARVNKEEAMSKCNRLIKNTYRVLMTRGMKGCYVYCCNKSLEEYFKGREEKMKEARVAFQKKMISK